MLEQWNVHEKEKTHSLNISKSLPDQILEINCPSLGRNIQLSEKDHFYFSGKSSNVKA
jgi:hypothetical protein